MNHQSLQAGLEISMVILCTVLFYYLYYYFANSRFAQKFSSSENPIGKEIVLFLFKKSTGFFVLGIIPALLYQFLLGKNFGEFGFTFSLLVENIQVILLLIVLIIAVTYLNQRMNRENNSLQIDVSEWSMSLFVINSFGWIIYLVAYEFLFRGILLFECYSFFGFWPAIAINVALNSALHMVNGKDQTLGAIVFSGVACYFAISRETILIPIIMHITLSLSSDYFSIVHNSQLSFLKSGSINLFKK